MIREIRINNKLFKTTKFIFVVNDLIDGKNKAQHVNDTKINKDNLYVFKLNRYFVVVHFTERQICSSKKQQKRGNLNLIPRKHLPNPPFWIIYISYYNKICNVI